MVYHPKLLDVERNQICNANFASTLFGPRSPRAFIEPARLNLSRAWHTLQYFATWPPSTSSTTSSTSNIFSFSQHASPNHHQIITMNPSRPDTGTATEASRGASRGSTGKEAALSSGAGPTGPTRVSPDNFPVAGGSGQPWDTYQKKI